MKIPFEDSKCLIVRKRNDQVRLNIIRIKIQHEIWKYPEIQGFFQAATGRVDTVRCVAGAQFFHRSKLLRMVAICFDAVPRIVDFFHQPGMDNGDVVALKVVVDINLPIAIDNIFATFGEAEIVESEIRWFAGECRQDSQQAMGRRN